MPKTKIIYQCTECGGQSTKWQGQCPHCFAWNTLVEEVIESKSIKRYASLAKTNALTKLDEVETLDILKRKTYFIDHGAATQTYLKAKNS